MPHSPDGVTMKCISWDLAMLYDRQNLVAQLTEYMYTYVDESIDHFDRGRESFASGALQMLRLKPT